MIKIAGISYFTVDEIILMHNNILSISPGRSGILDQGRLESILEHIQNNNYYPTLIEKITHLVYSIIQNHAFVDANKRTALQSGAYFLGENQHINKIDKYMEIMENVVVQVASNQINKEELKTVLTEIIKSN